MTAERTIESRRETAEAAKKAMFRRLSEPELSLGDVAREVCVSKRQLQRSFEMVGSKGFLHELSKMRVGYGARLLLDDPELTITEVVERVGLRHRSNFARLFRIHLGENPTAWRSRRQAAATQNASR